MTFFNIFSKKPIKTSNLKILIDHREKNSLIASELTRLGFKIEFKHLPVADYLLGNTAIERKTISDLKSSIISKRIIQQLLEIKQFPKHFLIIEGSQDDYYNNFQLHENAFRGFLLSVALEYQVPIIFTLNEKDTAKYLYVLAKKHPSEQSIRPSKIFLSKKEQLQFILEGFPNIGPKTAQKLLKYFSSIENIINASEEELKPILRKRSANFKNLCKLHY